MDRAQHFAGDLVERGESLEFFPQFFCCIFIFCFRSISVTLPMAEVALTSPLAREGAALRQQRVGAAWQKTIELLNNVDVSVAHK